MFQRFAPPASLAAYVDCLWVYEADAPPSLAPPSQERALPTGLPELLITLRRAGDQSLRVCERDRPASGESLPAAMARGAHSEWYHLETTPVLSQVGVYFKAGGATPFLPLPATELHNRHVALHDLWGRDALEVEERLLEAPTPAVRAELLTQALLTHASQPVAPHSAITAALHAFHQFPHPRAITTVAEQSGLSPRHFRALFRAQVGLSPKQFCRIRRFMRVLRHIPKGARVDWADLAISGGYYDQAHFIHEFRALAGMCPTAYARDRHPLFLAYVLLPE